MKENFSIKIYASSFVLQNDIFSGGYFFQQYSASSCVSMNVSVNWEEIENMQDLLFCRMISVQEVVLSTAVSSLGTLGRGAWTRRVGWNRGKIFSFFVQNRGKIFFFVQTRAKKFFFCSKPGQDFYFFLKPYDLETLIQEGFYICSDNSIFFGVQLQISWVVVIRELKADDSPSFSSASTIVVCFWHFFGIICSLEKFNRMISGRFFTLVFISLWDTLLPPLGLN